MATMSALKEPTQSLTDSDFSFICDFVYKASGIVLNDSKREMVIRRLTRIIRERKLPTYQAYCQLLKEGNECESNYFINAITTNLTSFYREQHHFDYLKNEELPRLLADKSTERLRIWSSASSTGEEPYSIAITLKEVLKQYIGRNIDSKVLATDIDSNVIAHGKQGIYKKELIEGVPEHLVRKYFIKGKGDSADLVKMASTVRQQVTFKQLNLLHQWPMQGKFDVIFCRNVVIYFDKETQLELFQRFYHQLKPNGLLFLGHSESLGEMQPYFSTIGRTMFRKLPQRTE